MPIQPKYNPPNPSTPFRLHGSEATQICYAFISGEAYASSIETSLSKVFHEDDVVDEDLFASGPEERAFGKKAD